MKISQALDKVDEKQIFIPAFQREYVWKREDAKQLIDSLIREYPTGTMLTWETSSPPELKGPFKYSPTQGSVKLLLDGQQRITTLYMLIRGSIPPYYTQEDITRPIMGLHVNLESLELSYYMKKRMEGNPLWQDITSIFQRKIRTKDIVRKLKADNREVSRELDDLIDDNMRNIENIVEREFPEQIIPPKATVKEAIDIFYKVNASGVALTDAELALAQISGYWPEARDVIKAKIAELSKHGFVFKIDFIVYALLACMYNLGSDMKKLHSDENLNTIYDDEGILTRESIKKVWDKLDTDTLDYVMNLMRSKAYIDHTSEINSIYALIPIISFCFNQKEAIPEPQLWRIIKWFYFSQIKARYVSQLPQKLDFDLRIIKEKEHPFEELLGVMAEEHRLTIVPEDFIGRTVSHPLFGLMKWYFKSKKATCFTTGLGLHKNIGGKYQLENDHIFPSAALQKHGYSRDNRIKYQMAQELTNRALLTQVANRKKSDNSAEEYLLNIKEKAPESLKKQCIPMEESLWKIEHFESFLNERRKLLACEFNAFLNNLASENDDNYGALTTEELILHGESAELEFKQSLRWGATDKVGINKAQFIILKTIAGFTNADGGTLLIGVTDSGELSGLESDYESLKGDKDEFELHLGSLIDASFSKVFRANNIKIKFPNIHDIEICQIDIKPNKSAIVLNSKDKNGLKIEKFYLRSGNQTTELGMAEASKYIESNFV